MQQQLLSPINYEEAPYESSRDLISITITQQGRPKVLLARRVVDFSVTLDNSDSTAYLAAQSVLSGYLNAGLPGIYKVIQQNDRVDVVPTQVLGISGSMRDITPVMSRPVSFPLATRSVVDTVQLIADSVSSQSGTHVLPLSLPFGILETVELSATTESAGDVIENLGIKLGRTVSYQCLYDATSKNYYLNLHILAPKNIPGGPPLHGYTRHPSAGPTNSPFFIKSK